jgi:VanZ family protein
VAQRRGWQLVWPWLVWGLLLAVWTVGLLCPIPSSNGTASFIPISLQFSAAKVLHLSAYCLLALLVCWLPARDGVRAGLWTGLLAHAALTEYGQTFVEGRTGSVSDVALDALGILLGIVAGLWWQRVRKSQETASGGRESPVREA